MTLNLTIHRRWYDKIAAGTKKIEYREIKQYWDSRLAGKSFKRILFRNGYRSDSPEMLIECRGIIKKRKYYHILLGDIIE